MASWRRQSERIAAAATALLFQVALYLALSQRELSWVEGTHAPSFIARILTSARPTHGAPPPVPIREHLIPLAVTENPIVRPIALPRPLTPAPHIDWKAGIQREVRDELARAHARPKLHFGFPQMPATEGRAPEFGWDEIHIERLQRLAHGVFDFGQHGCFIELWPPFAGCFHEPANGDLFKNMHRDERLPGPNSLP
jgi:hypothetical protein